MIYPDKIIKINAYIENDDVNSLIGEYNKYLWKDEFMTHYDEFISLTEKQNSLKCLDFLTKNNFVNCVDFDLEIINAFNSAISLNKFEWIKIFLNNFYEDGDKYPNNKELFKKNRNAIWADIDNEKLSRCSDNIFEFLWDKSIKHSNKLFIHLIVDGALEIGNIDRVKRIIELAEKNNLDPSFDNVISSGLKYGHIDFVDDILTKYKYEWNDNLLKDAFSSIAIAGQSKSLKYLLKKQDILLSENYELGGLIVECAIRGGRFEFLKDLVEKSFMIYSFGDFHDIKIEKSCWFYSQNGDKKENNYYLRIRRTIWEDMEYENSTENFHTISNIYRLIKDFEPEHLEEFINELKKSSFPELADIVIKLEMHDDLNNNLNNKVEKITSKSKPKI